MMFCCGRGLVGELSAIGIETAHTLVRSGANHANAGQVVSDALVECRHNNDWRIP